MAKRDLIEEALVEAKELEDASIENAKNMVLETFTPDFAEFFKDVLNESEDSDEEELDEDELYETDHDMGKLEDDEDEDGHDIGKGFTSEAYDYLDEGEYDDVDGDATPESEEYLPAEDRPTVKKTKEGWEDEGYSGKGDPGPEKGKSPLPGGTPKVKQTEEGWEDEGAGTISRQPDPEKNSNSGLGNVPKPKEDVYEWDDHDIEDLVEVDLYVENDDEDDDDEEELDEMDLYEEEDSDEDDEDEDEETNESYEYGRSGIFEEDEMETGEEDSEDEDDDEDEELDVPEDLFDDEDDSVNEEEDEEDYDVDVDVEDDDETDDDDDEVNEDYDLNEEEDDEEDEDDEDDEVNENLYVRTRSGFTKITPAEYLNNRIDTLMRENQELGEALDETLGKLQETHLFNAKLAHMNKLYMTGAFTNSEKQRIAGKLDECGTVRDVKSLYKTIISEMQEMNPLDDFSRLIKEQKVQQGSRVENIFESDDVARMRKLTFHKFDKE